MGGEGMYLLLVVHSCLCVCFFFFKQKTAYEMRISDWSSDVCSSDLACRSDHAGVEEQRLCGDRSDARSSFRSPWVSRILRGPLCAVVEIGRASCRERVCQYV